RRGRGAEPDRAPRRDARPGHRAVGVRDPCLPARRGAAAAAGPAGCQPMADLPRLRLAVPRRGRAGERGHRGRAGHHPPAGAAAPRPGPRLRGAVARSGALLAERGDIGPGVTPGPVTGGWLRMGGTGTPPAAGNVLLVGDAAGLINPLQGEGIAPGMVSARLAAGAVLAHPADP